MTRIINETSHRSIPQTRACRGAPLPGELNCRIRKEFLRWVPGYYEVVSFDGDYVNLRRTDIESDELNPVALALLPPGIEVGSKIKCEYFQYEIIG